MNNDNKSIKRECTLEEKYKFAIMTLQAIAQRKADRNEWSQAEAFIDCQDAAVITLQQLNEKITLK